jgi:hypothetical protein
MVGDWTFVKPRFPRGIPQEEEDHDPTFCLFERK